MQSGAPGRWAAVGTIFISTAEKNGSGTLSGSGFVCPVGMPMCSGKFQMYRQQTVCDSRRTVCQQGRDHDEYHSYLRAVPDTQTHVLLGQSWFTAKKLWQVVRERGFLITCGIRSNRSLRVADPSSEKGWRWQTLSAYGAQLSPDDFTLVSWPRGDRQVYVHVVQTRIKKLYTCRAIAY